MGGDDSYGNQSDLLTQFHRGCESPVSVRSKPFPPRGAVSTWGRGELGLRILHLLDSLDPCGFVDGSREGVLKVPWWITFVFFSTSKDGK